MRIFVDSLLANTLDLGAFKNIIADDDVLVVPNTIVDIAPFQENIDWVETQLKEGNIVVQIWATFKEMVSKPFFWSSCSQKTVSAESLEEAVEDLPNSDEILSLAELVEKYGIPKGSWIMGKWAPPAPLSEEAAIILGVDAATATRTDVLTAAKKANRMDIFDEYNVGYNRGLAHQHLCDAVINSGGYFTLI